MEETHFTVAYSPVPDETAGGGIGGVLATVHEITGKVIGERRIVILRDLGARAAEAKTAGEACITAAETLRNHIKDIPFALLYLTETDSQQAHLAAASGVEKGTGMSPLVLELNASDGRYAAWPVAVARRTEQIQVVENLSSIFENVPSGSWTDPPHTAVVLPIRSNIEHQLSGFLIAGLSPRLKLDDPYKDFLELATSQIATAITNARTYEEERKRSEALAEIDRAKTAFFSNVSHEFRTPLTLMLDPLEDLLAKSGDLPPEDREQLVVAHRNSLRLLKLVNSLLDFSRIEAGRVNASNTASDLSALTADLASNFRSAMETAGLELIVDCEPLPEPVYVDREMWEKIVLNLLSNAFKYTFEGRITVRLCAQDRLVMLSIEDTGTGSRSTNCRTFSNASTEWRVSAAERRRALELVLRWYRSL
jgi:signal transduction histidine kinase